MCGETLRTPFLVSRPELLAPLHPMRHQSPTQYPIALYIGSQTTHPLHEFPDTLAPNYPSNKKRISRNCPKRRKRYSRKLAPCSKALGKTHIENTSFYHKYSINLAKQHPYFPGFPTYFSRSLFRPTSPHPHYLINSLTYPQSHIYASFHPPICISPSTSTYLLNHSYVPA